MPPDPQRQPNPTTLATPRPQPQAAQTTAAGQVRDQARGMGYAGGRDLLRPPVPMTPEQKKAAAKKKGQLAGLSIEEMWAAHPHNYQEYYGDQGGSEEQNTSSGDVQEAAGWDPNQYGNTCAIRLSRMLNELGGAYAITPAKAVAAGIPRHRVIYAKKQKWYYLLAASEIATYVGSTLGNASKTWPASGRYKDGDAFQAAFDTDIRPIISGKKGIVFFDKIFGYSGTGHVDIFDGERLSDAPNWYPSQRLRVWYV